MLHLDAAKLAYASKLVEKCISEGAHRFRNLPCISALHQVLHVGIVSPAQH